MATTIKTTIIRDFLWKMQLIKLECQRNLWTTIFLSFVQEDNWVTTLISLEIWRSVICASSSKTGSTRCNRCTISCKQQMKKTISIGMIEMLLKINDTNRGTRGSKKGWIHDIMEKKDWLYLWRQLSLLLTWLDLLKRERTALFELKHKYITNWMIF